MKSEQVIVYDWFDIQDEICKIMQIEPKYFREYHKLVGGDHKDLWHACLKIVVPDRVSNDTIVSMYGIDDIDFWITKETVEWAKKCFEAYNQILNEIDPLNKGVLVKFSW